MTDIFLSYAEQDRALARRVAEALGAVGWDVWWDRRIPAGKTWREVLESQLKNMRCMVVLWSRRSVASDWVCEEAAEGRKLHKLVPVLIETVQPPVGFRELQAADLTRWDGSSTFAPLQELLVDIENMLGKSPASVRASPTIDVVRPSAKRRRLMFGALLAVLAISVTGGLFEVVGMRQRTASGNDRPERALAPEPSSSVRPESSSPTSETRSPKPSGEHASAPKQEIKLTVAATKERCARLKERLGAGDTLSEESRSFFLNACGR